MCSKKSFWMIAGMAGLGWLLSGCAAAAAATPSCGAMPPNACAGMADCPNPHATCTIRSACIGGRCAFAPTLTANCPCVPTNVRGCKRSDGTRGIQTCSVKDSNRTQWNACQ